jgi:hypothetical protein
MHKPVKIQCINDFKVTITTVAEPRFRLLSTLLALGPGTVMFNTTHIRIKFHWERSHVQDHFQPIKTQAHKYKVIVVVMRTFQFYFITTAKYL